jgi:hypothetical protein
MTAAVGSTFGDVASALALAVLLLPLALFAVRHAGGRGDPAQAALGIGAVVALLVPAGLLLSIVGELGAGGWLVVIAAADVLVLLWARGPAALVPVLMTAAAISFAIGAVAISRAGAIDQEREARFTQLWAVPQAGDEVELGVRNEEHATADYELRVAAAGSSGPLLERELRLGHGQTWAGTIELPSTARPVRVTAELFRSGTATAYRTVHLWTRPQH